MAFTSLGVVIVSTMTFVLGTFPEFQRDDPTVDPEYPTGLTTNSFFLVLLFIKKPLICLMDKSMTQQHSSLVLRTMKGYFELTPFKFPLPRLVHSIGISEKQGHTWHAWREDPRTPS